MPDFKQTCDTISQLNAMLSLPLHLQSTVEFALKELELPLSREDRDFFTQQTEINLFGAFTATDRRRARKVSSSYNLAEPTLTVQTPMIVTSIAVFGYAEPHAMLVEGNNVGPQAAVEALASGGTGIVPASPINLRNQAGALDALVNGDASALGIGFSPAHLEIGGPTWNFLWAYLSAYRLTVNCPHSAFETVMRERLVDIGNCGSLVDFRGFGSSEASHLYWTRRVNERLHEIQNAELAGLPAIAGTTESADPGYFLPINAEQNADFEITPNRTTGVARSYGTAQASADVERWFRLPYAIALDENTKIKLLIEKDNSGDSMSVYFDRMLDEACMKQNLGPIPAAPNSLNFPIAEADKAADPVGGVAAFTQIPAGLVRIGLGLKGVYVRKDVCAAWKAEMQDKDFLSQVMRGEVNLGCGVGGVENVPAGHVGER